MLYVLRHFVNLQNQTILAKTNETSSLINNLIYSSPLPPFQCWLRWARNPHIELSAIDEILYTFFRIYVQNCAGGRGFCLFYWFFKGVSLTFCQDCRLLRYCNWFETQSCNRFLTVTQTLVTLAVVNDGKLPH
jgi:hypothetical protein